SGLHYGRELAARHERQAPDVDPEPGGRSRDLTARLLAGREQAGEPGGGQAGRHLEEKGRLADAGLPCEQRNGGGHPPAAEDSIDTGLPGRDPALVRVLVRERREGYARRGRASTALLDRPPGAATGAPPRPLRELLPALATRQDRPDLAHLRTLASATDTLGRATHPGERGRGGAGGGPPPG